TSILPVQFPAEIGCLQYDVAVFVYDERHNPDIVSYLHDDALLAVTCWILYDIDVSLVQYLVADLLEGDVSMEDQPLVPVPVPSNTHVQIYPPVYTLSIPQCRRFHYDPGWNWGQKRHSLPLLPVAQILAECQQAKRGNRICSRRVHLQLLHQVK
ncbi:MAG: hypothetical protein H8D56_25720, partial [Planctomycetes bacterium]|nr:hypothetical protein [Planctomycetota bacterium]